MANVQVVATDGSRRNVDLAGAHTLRDAYVRVAAAFECSTQDFSLVYHGDTLARSELSIQDAGLLRGGSLVFVPAMHAGPDPRHKPAAVRGMQADQLLHTLSPSKHRVTLDKLRPMSKLAKTAVPFITEEHLRTLTTTGACLMEFLLDGVPTRIVLRAVPRQEPRRKQSSNKGACTGTPNSVPQIAQEMQEQHARTKASMQTILTHLKAMRVKKGVCVCFVAVCV